MKNATVIGRAEGSQGPFGSHGFITMDGDIFPSQRNYYTIRLNCNSSGGHHSPKSSKFFALGGFRGKPGHSSGEPRAGLPLKAPGGAMDDDTPSTSSSTTAQQQGNDLYTHRVTKLDTLAGIAVKYNVSVADIKRANGLLSDTAMFAKDYLLIPTKSMPIGQEYATIAGMIVTQYGRPVPLPVPSGELDDRGSHVSSALDQLRGYYGLGSASPSGPGPDYFRGHSDDERGHFRGSDVGRSDSGEVEMMEFDRQGLPRRSSASTLDEQAGTRAGYQVDERLRRRNTETSPAQRASGLEGDTCLDDSPDHFSGDSQETQSLQHSRSVGRPPTNGRLLQPLQRGQSGTGSDSRQKESLFQRIKRAASQPALAGPSAPPVSQVAQSAIASVSNVTRSDSSFTTSQRVSSLVQGMRGKDAKKD